MKTIKYLLSLLFTGVVFATHILSQCYNITLNNQQEINDFIKNYGTCNEVDYLTIRDRQNDIVDFDSLIHLIRINERLNLNDFSNTHEINISGLKNLRYVNQFQYGLTNVIGIFNSLDSIHLLSIKLDKSSFAPFKHLKHIENALNLKLTPFCSTEEIPIFTIGDHFQIGFSSNAYSPSFSDCIASFASRLDLSKRISLNLYPVDSFNLAWFPLPDKLESLIFSYHQKSDLSSISNIKSLNNISITYDLGGNDYGKGLGYIEEIESINLQNIKNEAIDYAALFPNIKHVKNSFLLFSDNFVTNLDFLEGVTAPDPEDPEQYWYVVSINDNKNLRNCNVSFLCEALRKYPEQILISNNAGLCTRAEVLKYCETVSTLDSDEKELMLSPNPASTNLRIIGLSGTVSYQIYNVYGTIVQSGTTNTEIGIQHLSKGMYVIQLKKHNGMIINKKFVKM